MINTQVQFKMDNLLRFTSSGIGDKGALTKTSHHILQNS